MTNTERYTGYTPSKVLSDLDGLPQPTPDLRPSPTTVERTFKVNLGDGVKCLGRNDDGTYEFAIESDARFGPVARWLTLKKAQHAAAAFTSTVSEALQAEAREAQQ